MIIKLKGTQAAAPTGSGTATNLSKATCVRVFNSGTTVRLVTLEESGGTDIGTFSLDGSDTVIIRKNPTDQLFAANAAVLACGVRVISASGLTG